MGRILPMNRTGCSSRNQRRLSKAIRRARALGFMPIWSRHPQRIVRDVYTAEGTEISAENDTFSAAAGRDYANKVEGSGFLKEY
jgi:citrate lyase beta subunit